VPASSDPAPGRRAHVARAALALAAGLLGVTAGRELTRIFTPG
jgi:hypothetical protein